MLVKILVFLINIPLGILLLLLATIVFDIAHVCLHRFARSSNGILRTIGALHTTHHQFLDAGLQIHEALIVQNIFRHVIPEFIVQVTVTFALISIFPTPAIIVALIIETMVFIFIMWNKPGVDVNHKNVTQLTAYRPLYFCVPEYHLLHHVYPTAYFSSWIKTLDHILGTGTAMTGRRILITGSPLPFAKAFTSELGKTGAEIYVLDDEHCSDTGVSIISLQNIDILVLCHKPTSDHDYQDIIEKFYTLHQHRKIPVEVWALVSKYEFADAAQHSYACYAKKLFKAEKIIYRHLVADGFASDISLARPLLKRILRGFNYVPGCWNFSMLRHYVQFVLK